MDVEQARLGCLFVVSAPAGTGKTTLVSRLTQEHSQIVQSISHTTRKPRGREKDGQDYFFVSEDGFKELISRDLFIEYAEVFGNYYGTSKAFLNEQRQKGKHVVLVIDTQGALRIKRYIPEACLIFILPPGLDALRERLFRRSTDSKKVMESRLLKASQEMAFAKDYDHQIVNDRFSKAYDKLKECIFNHINSRS